MTKAGTPTERAIILELDKVRFDPFETNQVVDLALAAGEMAFLRGGSIYRVILGLSEPAQGNIRFRGRRWEDRSVKETEDFRRRIGVVFDPHGPSSAGWISNLNVDENVYLGASFEQGRSQLSLRKRAKELADIFGLVEGLPTTRSAKTSPTELICSQWVRAFLVSRLDLLILENPLEFAPSTSVAAFVGEVKRAMAEGTAVLWVSEFPPAFDKLGLSPHFFATSASQ